MRNRRMDERVRLPGPSVALAATFLKRDLQRLDLHGQNIVLGRPLTLCVTFLARLLQHGLEHLELCGELVPLRRLLLKPRILFLQRLDGPRRDRDSPRDIRQRVAQVFARDAARDVAHDG